MNDKAGASPVAIRRCENDLASSLHDIGVVVLSEPEYVLHRATNDGMKSRISDVITEPLTRNTKKHRCKTKSYDLKIETSYDEDKGLGRLKLHFFMPGTKDKIHVLRHNVFLFD